MNKVSNLVVRVGLEKFKLVIDCGAVTDPYMIMNICSESRLESLN